MDMRYRVDYLEGRWGGEGRYAVRDTQTNKDVGVYDTYEEAMGVANSLEVDSDG